MKKNNGTEFFYKEKYPKDFEKYVTTTNKIKEKIKVYDFTGNAKGLCGLVANVRFLEPIGISILKSEITNNNSTNTSDINSSTLEDCPFEKLYKQILNNNG